ncbi:hypothetical protein HanPSC8_Chr03g0118201 [Helianthus annuus]|nr:hypothetical protein HanPSC8_Chr03g0118201 [Helianthus annuus]
MRSSVVCDIVYIMTRISGARRNECSESNKRESAGCYTCSFDDVNLHGVMIFNTDTVQNLCFQPSMMVIHARNTSTTLIHANRNCTRIPTRIR